MPTYRYQGRTLKGQIKKGEVEAPDEGAVRVSLRQQNIIPTKITPKGKEFTLSFLSGER
jgi:type II secretory pathway component PulF